MKRRDAGIARSNTSLGIFCLMLTLSGGCSNISAWRSEPRRMEQSFGNSITQMLALQTADPDAAYEADLSIAPPFNGEKAQRTLIEYQKDVAKPKEITNVINFNIGTSSN